MTYLVLVLVEDKRRGLPVELDSTMSGVNMLARRSQHNNEDRRVKDGSMSGRCAVKQWGLLADFTIP